MSDRVVFDEVVGTVDNPAGQSADEPQQTQPQSAPQHAHLADLRADRRRLERREARLWAD